MISTTSRPQKRSPSPPPFPLTSGLSTEALSDFSKPHPRLHRPGRGGRHAPPKQGGGKVTNLLVEFQSPDVRTDLVVEADSKVCYAYLRQHGRVCGDVWLYNTRPASDVPEWKLPDARSLLPFSNPPSLGHQIVEPIRDRGEVSVEWVQGQSGQPLARLYVRGQLWAVLGPGDKPGRCIHALADGPLARRLSHTESGAHP